MFVCLHPEGISKAQRALVAHCNLLLVMNRWMRCDLETVHELAKVERSNGVHAHVHMCVVKGVQEQMSVNGVRVQMFVCL